MGTFRIKEWKPVYTKILIMVQRGMRLDEISKAEEVKMNRDHLCRIVNSPLFRVRLNKYRDKVDERLLEKNLEEQIKHPEVELAKDKLAAATEQAADTLLELLNPKSKLSKNSSIHEKRLLLTIAQDILDRVGLKSVVTKEEQAQGREYSPDEIKSALANAKELEAISSRLGEQGSSYVLTREERNGAETTEALEPPAATEPSFSIETTEPTEAQPPTVEGETTDE